MSESLTARLGMSKPDPGTGEPVNVAKLNANFDKIDANVGPGDVTSTSRPLNPYPNQLIRESDTRKVYIWNATEGTWDSIGGGTVAVANFAALSGIGSPTEGLLAYVNDVDLVYGYNGSAWKIKSQIVAASLAALGSLSGALDGHVGVATDTNLMYVYNGSAWIRQAITKTGSHTFSITSSGTSGIQHITFSTAFPTVPSVTGNINNGAGTLNSWDVKCINVDATGFDLYIQGGAGYTGATVNVQWMASVGS